MHSGVAQQGAPAHLVVCECVSVGVGGACTCCQWYLPTVAAGHEIMCHWCCIAGAGNAAVHLGHHGHQLPGVSGMGRLHVRREGQYACSGRLLQTAPVCTTSCKTTRHIPRGIYMLFLAIVWPQSTRARSGSSDQNGMQLAAQVVCACRASCPVCHLTTTAGRLQLQPN